MARVLAHENNATLSLAVASLSGIGEKTLEILTKNNIESLFDLMLRAPKGMVQKKQCPGFLHMEVGRTYVASGVVLSTKLSGSGGKKKFEAILQDQTGRMTAVFFGPAVNYAQTILKRDAAVTILGQAKEFIGRIQMVHPKVLPKGPIDIEEPLATYAQIGGLNSAAFKRMIDRALTIIKKDLIEHLDDKMLESLRMSPLTQALVAIHTPTNEHNWDKRSTSVHYRRLAFEELLSFYVRFNQAQKQADRKRSWALAPRPLEELTEGFLPFNLTQAQKRCCKEILADTSNDRAMSRLLQGDVGSGKTAVCALISLHAVLQGLQVAVMAPTEILAEQLYHVFTKFFAHHSIGIGLLTASIKTKVRKEQNEKLINGEISIIVGTHALLSEDVVFSKLGLVIIDEQHRFGVNQRASLINNFSKTHDYHPHLLVMSATPIPRSLALTFYGDLDLSVIDERPSGRIPIHTQILAGPVLENIIRVAKRIRETQQKAFIVFPLVEESEHLDLENATRALKLLQEVFGEQHAILLHGKMKPKEKAKAMSLFRDTDITFLVSTTVVEVGIDVPNATCMVIAHPERFGLAQLHQLRGRVGRNDLKSYCFLLTDLENRYGSGYKRLNAMCETDNGFKLAEIDLEIRGPGELLGTRQSGLPTFLIFNHVDFADMVNAAKIEAQRIHERGLTAAHRHLLGLSPVSLS